VKYPGALGNKKTFGYKVGGSINMAAQLQRNEIPAEALGYQFACACKTKKALTKMLGLQ
jgi:hypothetical protein